MSGESFKTWAFRRMMNLYPMFLGTGGKITYLQRDWYRATIKLSLNIWTRNYVGVIFGGSMFSALDPFPMVLLLNILGKDRYVVWDKAGAIKFKKPGKGILLAQVEYTEDEVAGIRGQVEEKGFYEFVKPLSWIDKAGDVVSVVEKTVYVATKEHYRKRKAERQQH